MASGSFGAAGDTGGREPGPPHPNTPAPTWQPVLPWHSRSSSRESRASSLQLGGEEAAEAGASPVGSLLFCAELSAGGSSLFAADGDGSAGWEGALDCDREDEQPYKASNGQEAAAADEGQGDLINALLAPDLLLLIFAKLPWAAKRGTVYLVCRRWAALCMEPSDVWRNVKLDLSWEGRLGQVRGGAMIAWLNRRAPAVRALSVLRSEPVLTCRSAESFMGVERFFHDFYPVPVEGMRRLLHGLTNLQELTIESCNDLFIGRTYAALSTLSALTRLELARLRKSILSHPTEFLGSLTRLASLRICCEDDWHPGWVVLPEFPPEIERLRGLTHLSLTSKGIKEVPAFISRLAALRDLRLAGCGLSTLPPEVSALGCLTVLKLNNNPLGKGLSGDPEWEQSLLCLPEGLAALTALQRLELMQCKLKAVPEAVLQLGQLQELLLGFNRIDRLPYQPSELQGLSSLRHMSLFSNRLPGVPQAFSCLTRLEELFLDDNLQLEFPEPLFWVLHLPHLSCLSAVKDMEHIEEVPAHSWAHESLIHLMQLDDALRELHPGRRVLRLHHGYTCGGDGGSPPLRDRAW